MLPPGRVLVPEPELDEAPDDLFPKEVLELHEAQPTTPAGDAAEEDIFGLDKERQDEWTTVRKLMGSLKVNEKTARSFFANISDVSVSLEELAEEAVPPTLTIHHLREFRERLEKSRMNLK